MRLTKVAEVDYKRKSNKAIAEGEAVETFLAGGDSLAVTAPDIEAGCVL
jgi:hypothetical protein